MRIDRRVCPSELPVAQEEKKEERVSVCSFLKRNGRMGGGSRGDFGVAICSLPWCVLCTKYKQACFRKSCVGYFYSKMFRATPLKPYHAPDGNGWEEETGFIWYGMVRYCMCMYCLRLWPRNSRRGGT